MKTCKYVLKRIALLERKQVREPDTKQTHKHDREKHVGHHGPRSVKRTRMMEPDGSKSGKRYVGYLCDIHELSEALRHREVRPSPSHAVHRNIADLLNFRKS